jgi:hypothetical protein
MPCHQFTAESHQLQVLTQTLMRTIVLKLWIAASALLGSFAMAQTVNWVNWTAPGSYPSSVSGGGATINYASGANGTLTLPNSTAVTATLTGEVISQSCFTTNGCGWGSWAGLPSGTYTSSVVPSIPPTNNLIAQSGYANPAHTLTFSQPISNVVMDIYSLGNPSAASAYQFTQDFTILSQDSRCVPSTGYYCLVKSGLTLTGKEGSGTIQFLGTYSAVTWTVTVPEFYSGFNIGVSSVNASTPAPTVTAVSPGSGSTAGGTSITITGTDLTGATAVTVGGNACTNVVVVSATSITCSTPAGAAGTASILVTTPGGTNAANTLYTYATPAPAAPIPTLSEWAMIFLASLMAMFAYARTRRQ